MVIYLELGADLHTAQQMPLPLTVSCFSKIQICFTFLVPAQLVVPETRAVKRVCVCVSHKYVNLFLGLEIDCTFLRCIALLYFAIRLESCKSANKRIYLSIYLERDTQTDLETVVVLQRTRQTVALHRDQ